MLRHYIGYIGTIDSWTQLICLGLMHIDHQLRVLVGYNWNQVLNEHIKNALNRKTACVLQLPSYLPSCVLVIHDENNVRNGQDGNRLHHFRHIIKLTLIGRTHFILSLFCHLERITRLKPFCMKLGRTSIVLFKYRAR